MKNRIHRSAVALLVPLALSLALAGCGSGNGGSVTSTTPTPTSTAPTISLEKLRSAPSTATVGSASLQLSASLYLNTMPRIGGGSNSDGVSGVLTVSANNGVAVPVGMTLISAYTVQTNTSASFATLTPIVSQTADGGLHATVANGPALKPGTTVGVVVLFQDASGTQYLLQDPSVNIIGAD